MYSKGKKDKMKKRRSCTSDSTLSPAPAIANHVAMVYKSHNYYFEDGSFEIQVALTCYSLHKSILRRQSKFFEAVISDPSPIGGVYGRTKLGTPGNPYEISDRSVSQEGFELLLSIIYPAAYDTKLEYTLDDWFKILETSTFLEFTSIRSLAAKTLSELLDPFEKIGLGQTYDVDTLYLQGYKELCERAAFLSFDEGETLGLKDVIRIGQTREKLSKSGGSWDEVKDVFYADEADNRERPRTATKITAMKAELRAADEAARRAAIEAATDVEEARLAALEAAAEAAEEETPVEEAEAEIVEEETGFLFHQTGPLLNGNKTSWFS